MKKITIYILVILFCVVAILLIWPHKKLINEINSNELEPIGENILVLSSEYDDVKIPHLNIKGDVEGITAEAININLSEYSESFLETKVIAVKNEDCKLDVDDKVFVMLKDVMIQGSELRFTSMEIYTLMDNYNPKLENKDYIVCLDDYGGVFKIEGNTFNYEGKTYFLSDIDLSENNERFYKNIKNGDLLVEEYKSIVIPFKIYKMINPQETRFEDIIQIYQNKQKGEK